MYYLYVAIVLSLVTLVLLVLLSFHNLLNNRRYLNRTWRRIHALLSARNELLLKLKETAELYLPVQNENLFAFQDFLEEDTIHRWNDAKSRGEIRYDLENAAYATLTDIKTNPAAQGNPMLSGLLRSLTDNAASLKIEIRRFNKAADAYNKFFYKTSNRIIAGYRNMVPVEHFRNNFWIE